MDVTEKHPSKFFELTALNLRGSGSGLVWLTSLMPRFLAKLRVRLPGTAILISATSALKFLHDHKNESHNSAYAGCCDKRFGCRGRC